LTLDFDNGKPDLINTGTISDPESGTALLANSSGVYISCTQNQLAPG
jgi:hypothetical protein